MKFYSSIYEGAPKKYDISRMKGFEDAYSALEDANEKWNTKDSDSDDIDGRLLVVMRVLNDESKINNVYESAYFQFVNGETCRDFINNNRDIVWSKPGDEQKWNGDKELKGFRVIN